MPTIAVLGSTGVIGSLALEVISGLGDDYRLLGLAAKRNDRILAGQIRAYRPTIVAVGDSEAAERLAGAVPADIRPQIEVGAEAVERLAEHDEVDVVLNAITGAAGLKPTLAAVAAGKRIALANKESLVMAGEIVMAEARRT
ncbi:MAG: 1-deoxy-D-xylulose-5-phosphate reductoisomerase, partial [Phycisphaerae bacterium]|nr:1-deoxy-D-xylulose-5-phosphate reductoisomerase [Phycisphaerae bacterium]